MNSKCLNLKVKSRNFHRKITVMSVVSLLFMMLLVSSPLVSVFNEFSPFASACVYYNVTVNGSYATITGAGSYEACKTVTLNAGTRDGYTFSGWTVNAGGMKLKSNTSPTTTFVMPAKNVVVTANWTPIQYSILYALNGGVNAPSNPASYTVNTLPLSIANPSMLGHAFQYWMATYADGTEVVLPASGVPVGTTGNIILSAIWSTSSYSISYVLNGGVNAPSNPASYTVNTLPLSIANPSLLGYEFEHWRVVYADGSSGVLSSSGIPAGTTGNIVLSAVWSNTPILYTITYVLDGGVNAPGNSDVYAVTSIFPIDIANPSKAGYTFLGWIAIYANGTSTSVTPSYSIPVGSAGNVVLYAVWSQIIQSYSVSYVLNGGVNAPSNPASYTVNTLPLSIANPSRSGYVFSHWIMSCTDGSLVVLQNGVIPAGTTGDVTLTAVWTVAPSYSISYVLNGGVNAPSNPASYTVSNVPVGIADPSMAGYTFLYWIVVYADGSLGVLPPSGIPAGTTGSITLIAVWT